MSGIAGLVRAEVRRFSSRRLFRALGLGAVGFALFLAGLTFFQSSKDPDSGIAEAQEQIRMCEEATRDLPPQPEGAPPIECGTVEEFREFYDQRFRYADTMRDALHGLGVLFLVVGLVGGGSFVGAEWGTGSMTTLLTWEPRRGRVLLAKLLAGLSIVAVASALMLVFVSLLFLPVAVLRGTTAGLDGSYWWTQAGIGVRDVGLAAFGTAFGVSFATLFRNTAGAVGAGFFYGAVVDPLLSIWRDGLLREWVLQYNIVRLLGIPVPVETDASFGVVTQQVLSATRPAILLTVYAAAIVAIAYAVFRQRDVT